MPADLPRMEICLNGQWEVALNAAGDKMPEAGFAARRVPAAPMAAAGTESAWYRLKLVVPRAWAKPDRAFLLRIRKAGHYAAIYWNGRKVAEHYGQFTPFEADVTEVVKPGETNEIAVYVHNASGRYARAGAEITDPMEGNAYRGATDRVDQRNWVGIVGDIHLAWRPKAAWIEDVRVTTSVRKHQIQAAVKVAGSRPAVRTDVLDGDRVVMRLAPDRENEWRDAVLWGPEPYGKPKLYTLRTELRSGSKVVDRTFTRFGFREVWIDGKDVLLNGKKLWMAGTYFGKLAPIRYVDDRRPQSKVLAEMQESGLNTLHGHWDELGDPWLDRCDEAGVLVLGGFFCDGRPQIQSKADSGWVDWMTATCGDWVRANRHHPSIVIWRPTDVLPANVASRRPEIWAGFAKQVRANDGEGRPLADDTDILSFAQSPLKSPQPGAGPRQVSAADYDDASRMAALLAESKKPFLTKEIYTGFADFENVGRFFRLFYEKSFTGGSTGVIVQHLPIVQGGRPAPIEWASQSGEGNRLEVVPEARADFQPSPYSKLFAELYQQFTRRAPAAANGDTSGELLVSGLKPDDVAFLVPENPAVGAAVATRAAPDGTAWNAAAQGAYHLYHTGGSRTVKITARATEKVTVK